MLYRGPQHWELSSGTLPMLDALRVSNLAAGASASLSASSYGGVVVDLRRMLGD